MRLRRKVADWLEHRTGLESAVKNFLYEDIPASGRLAPDVWQRGSLPVFCFRLSRADWGAKLDEIVVVVLHMTQVFLGGAYKKPREAIWMGRCRVHANYSRFWDSQALRRERHACV